MFVVKGLWSEDKKVTYLYTQANEAKDALSCAAADMVYDVSAIARVDYVKVIPNNEDNLKWFNVTLSHTQLPDLKWFNVTLSHTQLPEEDKPWRKQYRHCKRTSKTRQALVQARGTTEAAAMVASDEELRGDEVVKIACAKYDEVK